MHILIYLLYYIQDIEEVYNNNRNVHVCFFTYAFCKTRQEFWKFLSNVELTRKLNAHEIHTARIKHLSLCLHSAYIRHNFNGLPLRDRKGPLNINVNNSNITFDLIQFIERNYYW